MAAAVAVGVGAQAVSERPTERTAGAAWTDGTETMALAAEMEASRSPMILKPSLT